MIFFFSFSVVKTLLEFSVWFTNQIIILFFINITWVLLLSEHKELKGMALRYFV